MSILTLSNIFNLLADQSKAAGDLKGYHMGNQLGETNQNHDNNQNVGNEYGNEYPYLLVLIPDGDFEGPKSQQINYAFDLYFEDLQWRDNDGLVDGRDMTDVVKLDNLIRIARNYIFNLYNIGVKKVFTDVNFTMRKVDFKTATMAHNDRKIVVQCRVFIEYIAPNCPSWTFDKALVPPDYDLADISIIDFETVIP